MLMPSLNCFCTKWDTLECRPASDPGGGPLSAADVVDGRTREVQRQNEFVRIQSRRRHKPFPRVKFKGRPAGQMLT